ncbi:MAG: hypothetical protein F4X71_07205 [Cenarchaeum sp. SB0662_bin_33]|nr:hypothetical protein [Cenarchaeum sp. SB0662_bin_33]
MPDFVHQEYDTVHIRDIIPMELDDIITVMSSVESGLIYWADGVLFVYFPTETESAVEDTSEEDAYLDRIIFTKYPEFSRTVKSSTNFEIPVVNVQKSRLFAELVQWIKSQPFWND